MAHRELHRARIADRVRPAPPWSSQESACLHVASHEVVKPVYRGSALNHVNRGPVDEHRESRSHSYAVRSSDLASLIGVDLDDLDGGRDGAGERSQVRLELLAGSTGCGEELDEHRPRMLEDLALKRRVVCLVKHEGFYHVGNTGPQCRFGAREQGAQGQSSRAKEARKRGLREEGSKEERRSPAL